MFDKLKETSVNKRTATAGAFLVGALSLTACGDSEPACTWRETELVYVEGGDTYWGYAAELLPNASLESRRGIIDHIEELNDNEPLMAGTHVVLPTPNSCAS